MLNCGCEIVIRPYNGNIMDSTLKRDHPNTATHHLPRALSLINDKLPGNDAVAGSTIAVVLSMSHYTGYKINLDLSQGLYIFEGSKRWLRWLRWWWHCEPGMEELPLAQKIFRS
ncbi:3268fab4-8622-4abe-b26d-83fc41660658 [Sclerotinia trifoliorum]|uniref:3268fab4-8622-4abe-b26d-83fc41660658 n=1 Tax=Sclerotinia trifoliorum TaxID=28548 RepID=A0A8H2VTB6_9HELO|nr:3268fab4-8622-4abe-b26d-83fc41660658 [Sclerotinia trifoliorum]